MVLHSFRVKEFRSVQDSGWIDAEQITALIGTTPLLEQRRIVMTVPDKPNSRLQTYITIR